MDIPAPFPTGIWQVQPGSPSSVRLYSSCGRFYRWQMYLAAMIILLESTGCSALLHSCSHVVTPCPLRIEASAVTMTRLNFPAPLPLIFSAPPCSILKLRDVLRGRGSVARAARGRHEVSLAGTALLLTLLLYTLISHSKA